MEHYNESVKSYWMKQKECDQLRIQINKLKNDNQNTKRNVFEEKISALSQNLQTEIQKNNTLTKQINDSTLEQLQRKIDLRNCKDKIDIIEAENIQLKLEMADNKTNLKFEELSKEYKESVALISKMDTQIIKLRTENDTIKKGEASKNQENINQSNDFLNLFPPPKKRKMSVNSDLYSNELFDISKYEADPLKLQIAKTTIDYFKNTINEPLTQLMLDKLVTSELERVLNEQKICQETSS